MTSEDWYELGHISQIPQRGARTVTLPDGQEAAVFRTGEDEIYALHNRCPHKKGPLSQGIVHGDSVTCPLHNWVISLRDGQAQGADRGCVPTLPIKVVDGRIFLSREALPAMAG